MNKFKLTFFLVFASLLSCSTESIEEEEFESIRMRIINTTEIQFSQISIVPCFNTEETFFEDVNPRDTTSFKDLKCGFRETIIKASSIEGLTYERNSIDFLLPSLPKGDYDCTISIKIGLELSAIILPSSD